MGQQQAGSVGDADVAVAVAAARLARADLASSTVMEMTALAGVMGRHYALQEVGSRNPITHCLSVHSAH